MNPKLLFLTEISYHKEILLVYLYEVKTYLIRQFINRVYM